jgi:AraC-like DNA-binding protein
MRPRNPLLRDRIASIDVVEAGEDAFVLPSTSVVLGMQSRGRVRAEDAYLSRAGVTGVQSKARRYSYQPNTRSVLVRFTGQGASCLGAPVSELTGTSVALDALLPGSLVREASERLAEARSEGDHVEIVETLLVRLPYVADPLVSRAIAMLDSVTSDAGVADVAKSLGKSERQLERRFLARVGVSPKRFAVLRRFERAVVLAKTAPSLTAAAHDAGYFDQSHFVRDFRRFTGHSPRSILMSGSSKSG